MGIVVIANETLAGDEHLLTARRTDLAACKIKLYQNSLVPGYDSTEADFAAAEATFVGYVGGTVTWDALSVDETGKPLVPGSDTFFQCTATTTPNVIGGCWLETAAGVLIDFWPFPTPINVNLALQYIRVSPSLMAQEADTLDVDF